MKGETMKPAIISLLILGALSASGENLLRNSSFELGSAEYSIAAGIPYSASDFTPGTAERDGSTRIHGKYSLFFPNPNGNVMQFSSHDVTLTPGKRYTFTCQLKSDRPAEVQLLLRSCTYDKKGYHWQNSSTVFRVTPEWKRFSFTMPAIPNGNPVWNLVLNWKTEKLWLDAVQLTATPESYVPAEPVEIAFERNQPVRFPGKNSFTLKAVNHSAGKVSRKVAVQLYDVFYKTAMPLTTLTFELEPGAVTERTFSADLSRYGTFELRTDAGNIPLLFSVLGKLPVRSYSFGNGFSAGVNGHLFHIQSTRFLPKDPDGLPPAPYFGACGMNMDEFFARTRLCGFGSIRLHDDGVFYWWRTERERGKYDWSHTDNIIRRARKNGIDILPRLGSSEFMVNIKHDKFANSWIRKASTPTDEAATPNFRRILPPPDAWEAFVYEFVNRYKNEIKCYEIMNEPNLYLSPARYKEYLKRAYRAAKKADPECTVVGFCTTGDLNSNLGQFLEECGKLGAFRYADAISFHPYSAQLDDSPIPAEQQIRQAFAIIGRYRPGMPLWNSELYFIQTMKGLDKPVEERGEFPAGNLIRRYLIDLGEGLSQSIAVWAPHIVGLDLRPGYKWPNFAASTFIPNEHAAATNAFARFLEGGKGIRKLDLLRGVSAWSYQNRNGYPVAACWAMEQGEKFKLELPENVIAYDLFGNPVPGKTVEIGNDPVYLKGKQPFDDWQSITVIPQRKLVVTGARNSVIGGKNVFAIEIRNNTRTKQNVAVRLPETEKQELALAPQEVRTLYFPAPEKPSGTITVLVSDDETVERFSVVPVSGRTARPGTPYPIGNNAEFEIRTSPEFLEFHVTVRDDKRGGRIKGAPWSGDGIEFFLDTAPDRELGRKDYTDSCYRLYLVPKSSNGLPEALSVSPNLNRNGIQYTLDDKGADFSTVVRIPWKNLGLPGPASLTFDIAVDDSDGERRHSQAVWAGGAENWCNRFLFGRLLLP